MSESSEQFVVKFDGEAHQVDIDTYARVLLGYSTVVREAAKEAGLSEPVVVSVCATKPGSLDVILEIAGQVIGGLFDYLKSHLSVDIAGVVSLALGLFKLKKDLANKDRVSNVTINGDNNVVLVAGGDVVETPSSVYEFYKNRPKATSAIDDMFEALEDNPTISGFELRKGDSQLFRAERSEFYAISESQNYENANIRKKTDEATLVVVKPCLVSSKTRKWEFFYSGRKMTASISDECFLSNLEEYTFQMGTQMNVLLETTEEYNDLYKTYEIKKYVVIKVSSVVPPAETLPLF